MDSRDLDEYGGLLGVARECRRAITRGKWGETDYPNAGIEGYGWEALSVHLLMRYVLGLREEEANSITICPVLPQALWRQGASYRIETLPWGNYLLSIECIVRDEKSYTLRLRYRARPVEEGLAEVHWMKPPSKKQKRISGNGKRSGEKGVPCTFHRLNDVCKTARAGHCMS
jgi:hypothetical protein